MEQYISDEQIKKKIRARKKRRRLVVRIVIMCLALIIAVSYGKMLGEKIGNRKYEEELANFVVTAEDVPIVNTGIAEIGNEDGDKFWSWYGYKSHVPWCACYVSWCEDQNGYLKSKQAPKFAACPDGVAWFKERGQWLSGGETPEAGDIIFFDWEHDGGVSHVGIVTGVVDDKVFTVEGNSSNRCRLKRYSLDARVILGYGQIKE